MCRALGHSGTLDWLHTAPSEVIHPILLRRKTTFSLFRAWRLKLESITSRCGVSSSSEGMSQTSAKGSLCTPTRCRISESEACSGCKRAAASAGRMQGVATKLRAFSCIVLARLFLLALRPFRVSEDSSEGSPVPSHPSALCTSQSRSSLQLYPLGGIPSVVRREGGQWGGGETGRRESLTAS